MHNSGVLLTDHNPLYDSRNTCALTLITTQQSLLWQNHLVYYDDKDHHELSWEDKTTPYHDDRDEDGMMGDEGMYYITSSATRGSSFMSPAVIV